MSLTKIKYKQILGAPINVLDYGATGNGTTDDTAAIQAAVTAGYAAGTTGFSLYFPTGTYLMSSTITMGNTAGTVGIPTRLYGDGRASVIKVTAANVNPFLWQGPHPDSDGAGNRTGSVTVENLRFTGPGASGSNTNSIALSFYGVQGITLRNTYASGWYAAESYHNVDLVNRFNVWIQQNYNGIISNASGYALNSSLNSFNSYGGQVGNHSNYGIHYLGGLNPCFYGVNFTVNRISIALSPGVLADGSAFATGMVTATPVISGCYFEGDVGTSIYLGGGASICRGAVIQGCNFIAAYAGPLITIANFSNALGKGTISDNTYDIGFAGSSFITQASSVEKIDCNNLNGTSIGDITPATGMFTTVGSKLILKLVGIGASVNILSVGAYGAYAMGILSIRATGAGTQTVKNYSMSINGGTSATGVVQMSAENYSGGTCAFTIGYADSSGTTTISINNTSGAIALYRVVVTIFDTSDVTYL